MIEADVPLYAAAKNSNVKWGSGDFFILTSTFLWVKKIIHSRASQVPSRRFVVFWANFELKPYLKTTI